MVRITDKKGNAHVFTLTDGTTLRVFAKKHKDIEEKLVSEEIKSAANLGLVLVEKFAETPVRGKQSLKPSPNVGKNDAKNTEEVKENV